MKFNPEEMTSQRVSVIIPTHNRSHYLEQAVASVLNQTHKAIEMIVVDDGSDKHHTKAIERIAGLSPAIGMLRHATPKGPGHARNLGLDKATGEFVLFLDDDDLLRPGMVSDGLIQSQRHPDSDAVICAARPSANWRRPDASVWVNIPKSQPMEPPGS